MRRHNHKPQVIPEPEKPAQRSLASRVMDAYTTFSGIDITAIFDNLVRTTTEAVAGSYHPTTDEFGIIIPRDNLTGTGVILTRERVPTYSFGSVRAQDIKRGQDAVKDPMVFTLFDRDAFHSMFIDESKLYYKQMEELGHSCKRT